MTRAEREAFIDDDGADIAVEHCRAEGILDAADEYRLINESVQRAAQPAPLGRGGGPAVGRHSSHNQRFEIRPLGVATAQCRRQHVAHGGFGVLARIPIGAIAAE